MMDKISLLCIPNGESTAFPVDINPQKTISHLKKAIKEKKDAFQGINAYELILHKVSVPGEGTTVNLTNVGSKESLTRGSSKVSKVFGTSPLPEKTIHVIVQRPSAEQPTQKAAPGPPRLVQEAFNRELENIEKKVFHADTPISRFLHSYVKGDIKLPDADCCVKGLPRAWLRSRYFSPELPQPALYLIHPRKPHETITTPPSVTALDTISRFQNNDIITFFGESGCGKARAVVEMLAQNWGVLL
ncbi:hypothetical protein BX616_010928 [Lobosporangium transversale]|nr:hypothetical protein BX616_010928 [Lobosporangium transversale]